MARFGSKKWIMEQWQNTTKRNIELMDEQIEEINKYLDELRRNDELECKIMKLESRIDLLENFIGEKLVSSEVIDARDCELDLSEE